jgi:hypothetical protein
MTMSIERYLTKDPNVPPPRPMKRWKPPGEARGARAIGFRSKGSGRAALQINGFRDGAESELELDAMLCMLAREDVVDVIGQSPQVSYVDDDGKPHKFTFDFTSLHRDGSRTAHSVKPKIFVGTSRVEEIHSLLQRQMSPGTAERINLITEEKLSEEERFNAHLIYTARRFPAPEHDAVIEKLIVDLHGATSIRSLCRASGLRGQAFRPVVRLIAAGKLRLTKRVKITPDAMVRRKEEA